MVSIYMSTSSNDVDSKKSTCGRNLTTTEISPKHVRANVFETDFP